MRIGPEGPEAIEDVRALVLALKAHHADVAPELGDVRDDEEFWAIKRAQYAQQMAERGGTLLVARTDDGAVVGFAFVVDEAVSPTWPGVAVHVEDLSVAPHARGAGLGGRLMDAIHAHAAGREVRLFVLAQNARARRFYAREGFVERVVQVSGRRP